MKDTLYEGDGVIIAEGDSAAQRASEASGRPLSEVRQTMDFAEAVVRQAKLQGIGVGVCYTACLNVLCMILRTLPEEARNDIVSSTTEGLCASIGGGSDTGRRQ